MKLVCPECKNDVAVSSAGAVHKGDVMECNHCGISLLITEAGEQEVTAEIVDEGK